MLFQKILLFMTLDEVLSYHFYNPLTHDVLTRSSLNNVPSGYKLLPPPKANRKKSRSQKGNRSGRCTDAGFTCNSPFDKSQTFQYECENDNNCPRNYKCCVQKCFVHKICTKVTSAKTEGPPLPPRGSNNKGTSYERPGNCEKWPYSCQNPYAYSLTSMFKCYFDRQCPKNFKCCQQSCFLHKICSRIIVGVENISYDNRNKTAETFVPTETVGIETENTTEADDVYISTIETKEDIKKVEDGFTTEDDYEEFKTNKELTTEITTEIENEYENKTQEIPEQESDYGDEDDEDLDEDEDEDEDEEIDEDEDYFPELEENGEKNKTADTSTSSIVNDLTSHEEEIAHVPELDNIPSELSIKLDTEKNGNEIYSNPSSTAAYALTQFPAENVNTPEVEYKSFQDKQTTQGLVLTTTKYVKATPSIKSPDPNAIIPEYAAYYYYYDDDDKHLQ